MKQIQAGSSQTRVTVGIWGELVNHDERKKILFLKKRLCWLKARIALDRDQGRSHKHGHFDRSEARALEWALEQLAILFPESAELEYTGDLKASSPNVERSEAIQDGKPPEAKP